MIARAVIGFVVHEMQRSHYVPFMFYLSFVVSIDNLQ
jgi:hypothetical protein